MIQNIRLKFAFYRLSNFLKKVKNKKYSPEELLEELFSKRMSLIQPWQFKGEFLKLLQHYSSIAPERIMEIGTANGGTLFAHCKLAKDNALIISVDLPGGKFGGGYPDWKTPIYKLFSKTNQSINLIRASSHETSTVNNVKEILNGKQLDYLFIDGDHTYNGVKKDFELYSPFVKTGGTIVFHDVAFHEGSSCEVDKYWNELKVNYKYHEFIDNPNQGKFGIGVIIK